MRKYILFLFLLVMFIPAWAAEFNDGTINGKIVDEQQSPVAFTTIFLKRTTDSSFVKGELTDDAGKFAIEQVKEGEYFIEIKAIGLQKLMVTGIRLSAGNPVYEAGIIVVKKAISELQAVTVAADKPFIERKADRMVVNVENSIIHAGSSVGEVMEKLPGVQVNQNGGISLKGKQGVIIMMDGKPTPVSGQDLANLLKGIPSSNVQKIEIITNPSAKYDAAGNAGIINIITKRNRKQGFNGSVNAGYGQGRYEKYNGGFNLSLKDKWYNLFVGYAGSYRLGFNNLRLTRNFYSSDTLNTVFETDNYIKFPVKTHAPKIGTDFYFSPNTSLSVLGTGIVNTLDETTANNTDILDSKKRKTGSFNFGNDSREKWYHYAVNTQFHHIFDTTGTDITADLDYATYQNTNDQLFTNTIRDANGILLGNTKLIGDQKGDLKIYSAKVDFAKPLKNKMKLESGIKSSYVTTDNNMIFYNQLNNELKFDSTQSNHFLYDENINAAYINWNKEFNKFSMQLGLRAEQTIANGKQLINGNTFKRNYTQLFPSLFFDYKFNENHGLNLSLGRRIDRPAYQQMNPFRSLIDATTYSEGNPYLGPQFTYNSEITYSYKNTLFATFGYSLTTDNITDVLIQDGEKRVTVQTLVNLNKVNFYSANLVYSKKLTKWWTTNTSLMSYYGIYDGTINRFTINQGTPSFYLNTSNSFALGKGFSMECSYWYSHRNLYGVTTMLSTSNLTVGIQKSLLKNRATLTLNVSDIFWNSYPSGITDFGNVNETWTSIRETRIANVSFIYRFGEGKPIRVRKNTGADDEKKRTGIG